MSVLPNRLGAGLIAAALLTAASAPAAEPLKPCFLITQWQGWSSPSPTVVYLKVNLHDIYRVDLSAGSNQLRSGNVHLVSKVRGPSTICSAIDLDLAVADDHGFSTPLIARSITKLTAQEAAAIPPKFRP